MSLKLTCLGTGSKGNCWILDCDGELLIIDAGISIKRIKQGIDYNLMAVQGVLISHAHHDHSMAVEDIKGCGLSVFEPFTVDCKVKTYGHYRIHVFPVPHGESECYGFYIKVGDHRMIYATDLEYIPYNFRKQELNTIIVECNYQDEYIDQLAKNYQHKALDHAELKTTIGIVEANLTDKLRTVIICHMGETSCDANECCDAIRKVVPESVIVDYGQTGKTWTL